MKFVELDLRPELLEALQAINFTDCTPIQEAVIPSVLKGRDVSGLAQTGTGKTGAFVIPLIDRILRLRSGESGERVPTNWKKNSFVLVLVPTRELATQVEGAVVQFGKTSGMRSVVIVGGSAYEDQKKALQQGVEFVVGTPGRILDLYKSHNLDLNGVAVIVFDEADRMFDMGFKDDMKFILRRVPRDRQFLLFSATLNFDVLNTSYQFGAEPVEFNMSRDQATAEGIDHEILHVGQGEKPMYLLSLLKKYAPQQCIVFSNFKHSVTRIAKFLKNNGIDAMEMSSLLSQAQRNKVFDSFRSGKKQILVATDVAARGLDVKGIDLVVNYDLPDEAEGYVHRIGRTGRAGGSGRAVGMVSDRDVDALVRIENYIKEKVKVGWLEDAELIKEFKPFPTEFEREERGPRPLRRAPPSGERGRGGRSRPPRGPKPPAQNAGNVANTGNGAPPAPRHPRKDRPPRAGGHHQRHDKKENPQNPQNKEAHGQTADATHKAVAPLHRDRQLGRHGGLFGNEQKPQDNRHGHQGSHRHGHKDHKHQNKPHAKSHAHPPGPMPPRRPLKKDTHRVYKTDDKGATPGIASKVKNFLSKFLK